ncbi:unnamed protein product, partial [Brenthis ino]
MLLQFLIQLSTKKLVSTMKIIVILATVLAAVVAIPADTYNPAYDNLNVEQITASGRLLTGFINCFLDKGPCTPEAADIKKVIPEALRTSCAKCSPKQQQLIRTIIEAFRTKLPELWKELVKKEDPKGEYKETIEKFLNSSD